MTTLEIIIAVLITIAYFWIMAFCKAAGKESRIENLVRRSEKGILEPDPHEDSYDLDRPIFNQNEVA